MLGMLGTPMLRRKSGPNGRSTIVAFLTPRRDNRAQFHLFADSAEGIRLPVSREAATKRGEEVLEDYLTSSAELEATP
jgi:hypothetical protein